MTDVVTTTPATKAADKVIVYRVKQFIDPEKLKTDIAYSLVDLSNAMIEQSAMAAHYGDLHVHAQRQVNDIKLLIETIEAKIYRNTRDACLEAGEKFTEPYLVNCVTAHPQVLALKRALNEAKQVAAIGATAVEAWHQRKDMLVQLGANERKDKEGELRVMDQESRQQLIERARARVTTPGK